MVRIMTSLAAGAVALGMSAAASAAPVVTAPITYSGSQQIGSILAAYSITTDGKLGSLDYSDVTAFNVTLSDSISSVNYGRTSAGGTGSDFGTFNATATALTIPLFESISFYTNATSMFGGYVGNLTFNYAATNTQIDDAAHGAGLFQSMAEANTKTPFATAVTAAVPEPAAWAMMMLGVGALGVMTRRQRVSARLRFA